MLNDAIVYMVWAAFAVTMIVIYVIKKDSQGSVELGLAIPLVIIVGLAWGCLIVIGHYAPEALKVAGVS